ncbi:chemotaxis response regulator protein-glutamate methylesterase [Candidatus Tenderia electrophaga]|jgi:two-component system chemotaxis response regulator CheB|uniref:Protein-glutamate methylesterase/protein-glutamine glutaminase n=1 Tax=Candidatus Tenderia electrophaga TaxID=1748243 RepID=A0A0S2TBX9_9GAMM|nr:chemotaxis response regulator protein-glutamate methylesterase [Candidatus Tenderia electrophaga]
MAKIKVLIVDDSALVRKLLTEMLSDAPGIEVVGAAQDPYIAREKIKQLQPDVLTLDVEMPRMDGLTFLKNLMRLHPMPVVMVSSLTEAGADVTLEALETGAIDFVTKPKLDLAEGLGAYRDELVNKLKTAAAVSKTALLIRSASLQVRQKNSVDAVIQKEIGKHYRTTDRLIAMGASTGGTEAIREVLVDMPPDAPGIVIAQHIPAAFSEPFARRMDSLCAIHVKQAEDGDQILPGHAYIAPGDAHLLVVRDGAKYRCRLSDGPPVNRHRPAVDVLFRSVAQTAGPNALGVILTGMGADGADGLNEMRQAGAQTIAQDEKTSVVWGMPGEAVKRGAVDFVLPLNTVVRKLIELIRK